MLEISPNCNIEFGKRIAASRSLQPCNNSSSHQDSPTNKRTQDASSASKATPNVDSLPPTLAEYSQSNKLKNSTISRVPSAKSRLRQPVATSCLSSPSPSTPSIGPRLTISRTTTIGGESNSSKQTQEPEGDQDKVQEESQNVAANCRLNHRPSSTTKQMLRSSQTPTNPAKSSTTTTTTNQKSRTLAPKIAKTCTSILPRLTTTKTLTRKLADSTGRENDNQAAHSNGTTTTTTTTTPNSSHSVGRCIPTPRPELVKRTSTSSHCLNNAKKKNNSNNQAQQQQTALANGTQGE